MTKAAQLGSKMVFVYFIDCCKVWEKSEFCLEFALFANVGREFDVSRKGCMGAMIHPCAKGFFIW